MAKVELDLQAAGIPGVNGKVTIDNAASEQTLADLVKAFKTYSKAKGIEIDELNKALDKNTDATEDNTDAKERETKTVDEASRELERFGYQIQNVARSINGLITSGTGLASNMAGVGNSVASAASTLDAIPIVGGTLATVFGAVARSAEQVVDSFIKATGSGATFNGTVLEMARNAGLAGMTLDQFGDLIRSNGDGLLGLASNTATGARRFSLLSRRILNTSDDLFALGFSTQDLNESLARYSAQQRFLGRQEQQTDQQLIAGTRQYVRDLDVLAKITGQERKEKERERDALARDAQFRLGMANKSQDVIRSFGNLITAVPEGPLQDFIKDVVTTGAVTNETNGVIASQMGRTFTMLQQFEQMRRNNIAISDQQMQEFLNVFGDEGRAAVSILGAAGQAANVELRDAFNAVADAAQIPRDAFKSAKESQDTAIKSTDGFNTQIQKSQQQIAQLGNFFQIALAQSGILPYVLDTFSILANLTANIVLPAFRTLGTFIGENIGAILALTGVVLSAKGALAAYKAIVAVQTALDATRNLGMTASIASLLGLTAGATGATVALGPFALIGAAIVGTLGLLGAALYSLYKTGWTLDIAFENFGLNLQRIGLYLSDFGIFLRNQLPDWLGGLSDAEADKRRADNDLARQKIEDAKKDLAARRAQNAEERSLTSGLVPNYQELIELQEQDIDQKKTMMGLNYSGDPVALLKGFAKQENSEFITDTEASGSSAQTSTTPATTTTSTTRPTSVGTPRSAASQQLAATQQALNSLEALPTQERQKVQTQIDALKKQKDQLIEEIKNQNSGSTQSNTTSSSAGGNILSPGASGQNTSALSTDQVNILLAEILRYARETSMNTKRTADGVGSMSGDLYSNLG